MTTDSHSLLKRTDELLITASDFWSKIPGCTRLIPETDCLRRKLLQPCVLAVGGKVKAGKSSFINALLGKQLAKVGELETTATINMFRHISEATPGYSPKRPVKVVWENGSSTWETSDFMDSLQGNDQTTLRRAEGISHLEFYEDNPLLRELTLVDTPGTDAVVGEDGNAHQDVTDRFFGLRQKHNEQTNTEMAVADAVIYLVGAVPNAPSKRFLEDFRAVSSEASALNALGVLSKVDIDEQLLENRLNQADSVASILRDELYTVIPVSAGLHDIVEEQIEHFAQLQAWLKQMPPKAFKFFMRSDKDYFTDNKAYIDAVYKGTNTPPPSVSEREQMKNGIQWSLFRTISNVLYEAENVSAAVVLLKGISNIEAVRKTVNDCFFDRSKILRCNSVLHSLQHIALNVKRTVFAEMRRNRADYDAWMSIIKLGEQVGARNAAIELRQFIINNLPAADKIDELEKEFYNQVILPIENLLLDLNEVDSCFQVLALLQSRRDMWPENDYSELCNLFGLYGNPVFIEGTDYAERQSYWMAKSSRYRDKRDRIVADFAVQSYGKLLLNETKLK